MRASARLIVALMMAAGACPASAARTAATTPSLSPDLVAVAAWAKKVTAAQQPALDVYARCQPATARAAAAFGDRSASLAAMPDLIQCVTDFELAARDAGRALATVGPMPRSLEAAFKLDSADYLRRSADVLIVMATALHDLRVGLEAAQAGDRATAQASLEKMRSGSVAAVDSQILTLELIARAAPARGARALLNMRLVTSRAIRAVLAAPVTAQGIFIGDSLAPLAAPARAAASEIQPGWANDSAVSRRILAGMNDPNRKAVLARADAMYRQLSAHADRVADALETAPVGTVSPTTLQAFTRIMAQFDIAVVQSAASLSAFVQEHR